MFKSLKKKEQECELIAAASKGYTETVSRLLEQGVPADPVSIAPEDRYYGSSALFVAARNGHSGAVKLLLEHGADPEHRDGPGMTPVIYSTANNHKEILKMLIDAGADVNAASASGFTAFMAAARYRGPEIIDLLLEHGADIGARDQSGQTALHFAMYRNDPCNGKDEFLPVVRRLIEKGADLNAVDNNGDTPLDIMKERDPDIYNMYADELNDIFLLQKRIPMEDKHNDTKSGYEFDI